MSTVETRDSRNALPTRTPEPVTQTSTQTTPVQAAAGGSLLESLGGLATIVITIVGLCAYLHPGLMAGLAAVSSIILGGALLFAGGSTVARYSRVLRDSSSVSQTTVDLGGGTMAQFLAGATGIVLGILALLGVASGVLVPVAAITFGAALLLGCGATARLNTSVVDGFYGTTHEYARRMAGEMVAATNGLQILAGLAAVILGIIALASTVYPFILSLVAMLVVGSAIMLSGLAVSGKMLTTLRR